jgi:hypothetical protein
VRPDDAPRAAVAGPRTRVAHPTRNLRFVDRPADPKRDEGQGHIPQHPHPHLLLVELADLEDAGTVGREILGLVDRPPVATDGQQLGMQEPVELIHVTCEHGCLQRSLRTHRLAAHTARARERGFAQGEAAG